MKNCRFYHSQEALDRAIKRSRSPSTGRTKGKGKGRNKGKGKGGRPSTPRGDKGKDARSGGVEICVDDKWGTPQGKSVHGTGAVYLIVKGEDPSVGIVQFSNQAETYTYDESEPITKLSRSARRRRNAASRLSPTSAGTQQAPSSVSPAPMAASSLTPGVSSVLELPDTCWETVENDPSGCQFLTECRLGDRKTKLMLDTGSAVNSIPEAVLVAVLNDCCAKGIRMGDARHPVYKLEKWYEEEAVKGLSLIHI